MIEKEKINIDKPILIAGFGAIGKTTLSKKYKNVLDLESSNYKYIIDDELIIIEEEQRKGMKARTLNPEFPINYYNAIIDGLKKRNIVLISMHSEIIELLNENNIGYIVVYPKEEMLEEIITRCKERGNTVEFISGIKEAYLRLYPKNSKNIIWLNSGEYLEDVLKKEKII